MKNNERSYLFKIWLTATPISAIFNLVIPVITNQPLAGLALPGGILIIAYFGYVVLNVLLLIIPCLSLYLVLCSCLFKSIKTALLKKLLILCFGLLIMLLFFNVTSRTIFYCPGCGSADLFLIHTYEFSETIILVTCILFYKLSPAKPANRED